MWLAVLILVAFGAGTAAGYWLIPHPALDPWAEVERQMEAIRAEVLPAQGFATKIVLGDVIPKLVEAGVIDPAKFEQIYSRRGGLTAEQKAYFTAPSQTPLKITKDNEQFIVNILWPLGIANKNSILATSEAGKPENVNNLAATGGWTLGKSENGGDYYNKFEIIKLTPEQDALVKRVADNIYRPCCGNSTAFPDCNHGAAVLGMLQLGAVSGMTEKELYEEALKLNSFWFPDEYFKTAMFFKRLQNKAWKDVDPKVILSADYSSSRGWAKNVALPLAGLPGIGGGGGGGGSCGA